MLSKMSSLLGIGLLVLWGVGLGDPSASPWLTWLVGIAALFAFGITVFSSPFPSRAERIRRPLILAGFLGVLWLAGITSDGARWLPWWTLGFAGTFLLLSLAGSRKRDREQVMYNFKKAA